MARLSVAPTVDHANLTKWGWLELIVMASKSLGHDHGISKGIDDSDISSACLNIYTVQESCC